MSDYGIAAKMGHSASMLKRPCVKQLLWRVAAGIEDVVQRVESLPSMPKVLGSIPRTV